MPHGWRGAYQLNNQLINIAAEIGHWWLSDPTKVEELRLEYERVEQQWRDAIDGLSLELWELFGRALDRGLRARGVPEHAQIVWMPSSALSALPIGIARDGAPGNWLGARYEFVNAQSLQMLHSAMTTLKGAQTASLAVIINPTADLPFTEAEGTLVARHFPPNTILRLDQDSATTASVLSALKGKSHWHFSTHGIFSPDNRKSGLVMQGGKLLTGEILMRSHHTGAPRLVTLSACESGLYKVYPQNELPDSFFGLTSVFLGKGAAGVLGTLWPIDDRASALLIAKFYDFYRGGGLAPSSALRNAQTWLREATRAELVAYVKATALAQSTELGYLAPLQASLATRRTGFQRLAERFATIPSDGKRIEGPPITPEPGRRSEEAPSDERPFFHPYFWGGFIHTGL